MADEIEILTENEAGDSWVDGTPGAVSTGYGAQNTNIEAIRNGADKFDVQYSSPNIIVNISGVADDNGLPMVVKSQILIDISAQANGTYYLAIVAGTTTLKRSISLVTTPGTWDASKSGFYESGDRILDTIIIKDATGVYLAKRFDNDTKGLKGQFIDTGHGQNQVYAMDQDVKTDSDVQFNDGVFNKITGISINTGLGDFEVGQSNRTTDNMTFNQVTLPQGLARGISYENVTTAGQEGDNLGTMGSMLVGEVRFVAVTHTDTGASDPSRGVVRTPSSGTYYIVGSDLSNGGGIIGASTNFLYTESVTEAVARNATIILRVS